MIRVLIVDDEELLRKGLIALLDWAALGFEIAGEASSGKEALDFVENNPVDLIITDIRMPVMDGNALIKAIREKSSRMKFIILSGYDDFTYARDAMRYSVNAYVLKPIDEQEITDELMAVKKEIESETADNNFKNDLMKSAKENFINKLLGGGVEEQEFETSVETLNLNFCSKNFCVAVLSISNINNADRNSPEYILLQNFRNEYIGEILVKFVDHTIFNTVFIFNGEDSIKRSEFFLSELTESLSKHEGIRFNIGVGLPYEGEANVQKSYQEALEALKYKTTFGTNCIIYLSRVKVRRNDLTIYPLNLETKLFEVVNTGRTDQIAPLVNEFLDTVMEGRVLNSDNLKLIVQELLITFHHNFSYEISNPDSKKMISMIDNLSSVEDFKAYLLQIFESYSMKFSHESVNSGNKVVEDVKKYVNEFYYKKVTLENIAKMFFISKSHFCKIFKEYTGTNFYQYLNDVRIEKSKQLLKSSYYKNYEIAEKIGFENVSYFNQLFKRVTGVTPRDFRNFSK